MRSKYKTVLKEQILDQADTGDTDTLDEILKRLTDDELESLIWDYNKYKINQVG